LQTVQCNAEAQKEKWTCLKDTDDCTISNSLPVAGNLMWGKGNCAIQIEYFSKESKYCCLPDRR